jgi:hypothetical protein
MEILGRVAFDHPNITQTVQNYFQLNNFLGALSAKVIPEIYEGDTLYYSPYLQILISPKTTN